MPKYSAGAYITLTIGGNDITLDTANTALTPIAYQLPSGSSIQAKLSDVQTFIDTNMGFTNGLTIPSFLQTIVDNTSISIDDFLVATTGDAGLEVALTVTSTDGYEIFPGLKIKKLGLRASRAADPTILAAEDSTGAAITTVKANDTFLIGGTGFANARAVLIGNATTQVPMVFTPGNDNFFINVTVPTLTLADKSPVNLYITLADGTNIDSTQNTNFKPITYSAS